ncbi:hypothetical protein BZG35_12780 [Brevundimonas sp. LM2]|uniref:DUF5615 family PIN-like protein n=1 Tax=Brevundimonas sp. LM2 TaxID=1938605 RepID=UPI000983CB49|nr:DUF5615 family PIN-like protein [Brevundimonas sp. LM2]AQR62420.1 hypothetical protein BZG35_12780 [Brevundimonas sp. LM2]
MRFVVDANLPPDIADWLRSRGHDAVAVRDLGLRESPDGPIWDAALARGAVVITKDADFAMWALSRDPAPRIVWLRTGNLRRRAQLEHLDKVWLSVLNRLANDAPIVEVW